MGVFDVAAAQLEQQEEERKHLRERVAAIARQKEADFVASMAAMAVTIQDCGLKTRYKVVKLNRKAT